MISKKFSKEFIVGMFVIFAIIILVSFVFFISGFQLIRPGYLIRINFSYANGVKFNSPVRVAGVEVGEVKGVSIAGIENNKTKVEVLAWIISDIKIPRDSSVFVNSLGLLGEKYIEIIPGKNYQDILAEGDVIRGEDPLSMFNITEYTQDIANKLTQTASNIEKITSMLAEGKGTVGRLLSDESLYENIDSFVADIKANPWKLLWRTKEKKINR